MIPEALGVIRFLDWFWKHVKGNAMWIPFGSAEWKASLVLAARYQTLIQDAIREDSDHFFFRKIQYLYPKLEKLGVNMPAVRPFYFGSERCRLYHVSLLKDLDHQISKIEEDRKLLDLDRWAEIVSLREEHREELIREPECK